MKRFARITLTLLFIALVVEIVIIAPIEVNRQVDIIDEPLPKVTQEQEEANQVMRGGHVVVTRNEEKEWELWSEKALGFQEKGFWALDKVKAIFFAENGVSFVVTGTKGTVELESKNMTIEGDVQTRSSNGYLFRTQRVEYNSEMRRLFSTSEVTMVGPKDEKGHALFLKGGHLEADMERAVMQVVDDVRGTKSIDEDRRLRISSDVAEFSGQARSARFMSHVVIDMDSMRISGTEANFFYDSNTKNLLKSVEIKGGIRVSDAQKWATSDRVSVHFNEDKVIFSGNPRVVQDNDELRGERIIFSNGGQRVQVEKARAKVGKDSMENF